MITYKELLDYFNIITEEEFNKAIKLVPEINSVDLLPDVRSDVDSIEDAEDLCKLLIDSYLESISSSAYVEDIFLSEMKIYISDVETEEEAKTIFEKLSSYGWNVVNYDDIIKEINYWKKNTLVYEIRSKISHLSENQLEKLNKFISEL